MAPRPPLTWSAMSQSAFPQATGIVQVQSTQSTARLIREVHNEDELRVAIAELASTRPAASNSDLAAAVQGGEIIIASAMSIAAAVEIPEKCIGITIRGAGFCPLIPRAPLSRLFLVNAAGVTISNVMLFPSGSTNVATTFVEIGSVANAGDSLLISRCVVVADRVLVDAEGASSIRVENVQQSEVSGTHSASISVTGTRGKIVGCNLVDGGGDTITIGAGGGKWAVIGNDCGGGDITASASDGGNTIMGNTDVGTISGGAGDIFQTAAADEYNA